MSDPVAPSELAWQLLADARYLQLTTFRKDGTPVPTPVWAAPDGDRLLVWTAPTAGKVKRLRRNERISLAPCSARGEVTGSPVEAKGRVLDPTPDEIARVRRALVTKYGLQARVAFLPHRLWGRPAGALELRRD